MRYSLAGLSRGRTIILGVIATALVAGRAAVAAPSPAVAAVPGDTLTLNGEWGTGIDRAYTGSATVPGLAENPGDMSPGVLWYRRNVELPPGDWTQATLRLNGARFAPTVYIDGEKEFVAEGGMAPIEHVLRSAHVAPGRTIQLEIALQSLRDLDPGDASAVPAADRWRSDISSGLWDDVSLHFSRGVRITRLVPWTDFRADRLTVHWQLETPATPPGPAGLAVQALVLGERGEILARSAQVAVTGDAGVLPIDLRHACAAWTPDTPRTYRVRLVVTAGMRELDRREITWGLRDFHTADRRFVLNGDPVQLRGATVVWHRWVRDPEARTLAWDTAWFEQNIVHRLKALGANMLRFHLGLPPEALLDLCDRDGLLVQLEWPFFHGVKAAPASMERQWRDWLDVAMRHPSVVLIHPWNETEGDELKKAWSALDAVLPEFPPLVVSHRDVTPIHKYWWSLFENLGLYYDSAAQFPGPIMVDEFGGNYLDGRGAPGAYPTVRESLLRFLGREHTPERRLQFQAETNARVAEYWRRLGAAGFAPFCALSSPEDGNNWFLGPLKEGRPKPVWAALAAAYAPLSVSLEIWDRNFVPGQEVRLPVWFFNDRGQSRDLRAIVRVVAADGSGRVLTRQTLVQTVPAHGTVTATAVVKVPAEVGSWRFEAELTTPVEGVTSPIVSSWQFRTLRVEAPAALRHAVIGVVADEPELQALLVQNGLQPAPLDSPQATALVLSATSWTHLTHSPELRQTLQAAVERGQSVVLLDIGPRDLGQGYKPGDLGPLEGAPRVTNPRVEQQALFAGIAVTFREAAEPESHLHPAAVNNDLWANLPRESTWLWNGLRGGLVVPAEDMEVAGLAPEALAALWVGRGADAAALRSGNRYYAYQLADFYAFAPTDNDKDVIARLRAKVKFLAEDAPALQDRINPNAPVEVTDLGGAYRASQTAGQATALVPLASCGKNLSRTPIVELGFGPRRGRVVLSQVLTAGRLRRGAAEPGLYGIRYDPAAEQFVLNLIARATAPVTPP